MTNTITSQRASGCMFGLAFGDALEARTEFLNVSEILHDFPPDGPLEPPGNLALVTDDTQMTLAGAYHGLAAWPAEWIARIEYRDQLSRLGNTWDR